MSEASGGKEQIIDRLEDAWCWVLAKNEVRFGDSPEGTIGNKIFRAVTALEDLELRALDTKSYIQDPIEGPFGHPHDVSHYQRKKRLGVFYAIDTRSPYAYSDPESGFSIEEGEPYLELQLPGRKKTTLDGPRVRESLDMAHEYVAEQKLGSSYILGITYEKLARLAVNRFGFEMTYPPENELPPKEIERVRAYLEDYSGAYRSTNGAGRLAIAYTRPRIMN